MTDNEDSKEQYEALEKPSITDAKTAYEKLKWAIFQYSSWAFLGLLVKAAISIHRYVRRYDG